MITRILQFVLFLILFNNLIFSQEVVLSRSLQAYNLSSGNYDGSGLKNPYEVFRKVITYPNANWLRLKFNSVNLGKNSYIVIKAIEDTSVQILNSVEIENWNFTSAYFNGNSLIISLYVAPGDKNIFFNITEIFVGEVSNHVLNKVNQPNGIESLCGSDNRILSNEKAVGRIITEPSGTFGTGFILFNGRIATAAHVVRNISNTESSIIEFNVPLSNSDGSIKHAAANDQYTFKRSFIVGISPADVEGDDWAIFYTNTNNGLGAKERQNSFFYVEQNNSFQTVRVTGYGQDDGSYNHVQQTANGPNQGSSGNIVKYAVDTKDDNSGSPVINEANGKAVGIHTSGHCSDFGYNSGTSFFNSSLWDAVNPLTDLTIHQKLESSSELTNTYIGRWTGSLAAGNFQNYPVSQAGALIEDVIYGNEETFRAKQDLTTTAQKEKYNSWKINSADDPNVINHQSFTITTDLTNLTSQFKKSYDGITVKNEYSEVPGLNPSTDVIEFRDPWLIDYNDPIYNGTTYRNRGMDAALFKSRSTPFYPNYDSYYGSDQYLGVFLNQEYDPQGDVASYSVRSPIQQPQEVYLSQTGRYHKFYFGYWSSSGTDPLQSNYVGAYNESPVVFRSGTAVLTANLKGTQLSNGGGIINASQRNFLRCDLNRLHLVYSSMGHVWYERSTNNGTTWEIMNGGKPIDIYLGSNPSIDYVPSGGSGHDNIVITYLDNNYNTIIAEYFQDGVN